jgi:hypothetical protein
MPTATQTHTIPTRLSALGFPAAAIVAGLTVPAIAARREAEDPILALYRRYCALQDAHAVVEQRAQLLRAGLVERWGEIDSGPGARHRW